MSKLINENSPEFRSLQSFIINNSDLEKLESLLSEFNIFDTLGVIKQELRHSDFLAFLLNPVINQGFGSIFLKKFLQQISILSESTKLTAIDFDTINYSDIQIDREWRNIDILITIPSLKFICAIENKIMSTEHSDQLNRYEKILLSEFNYYEFFLVYLTPDASLPSSENWLPFSYSSVHDLLKISLNSKKDDISQDLFTLIKHYITMLDRHINPESEVSELCQKIYKQHKTALDLIFEHRPDNLQNIKLFLESIIQNEKNINLSLDFSSKGYIRFSPSSWDSLPFQKKGSGWTRSKRILLFEFRNVEDSLILYLLIGPGESSIREHIYNIASNNSKIFKGYLKNLTPKWTMIYKQKFLVKKDFQDSSFEEFTTKAKDIWIKFVSNDLPKIVGIINSNLNEFENE